MAVCVLIALVLSQRREARLNGTYADVAPSFTANSSSASFTPDAWRVARVVDGDTVEVERGGEHVRVRLSRIDAPETSQPGGAESAAYLRRMVEGKHVQLSGNTTDKYGRTLGELTINGLSVNAAMVENGMAWHYTKYAPNDTTLASAEASAKQRGLGVWAAANPTAPWDYRHHTNTGERPSAELTTNTPITIAPTPAIQWGTPIRAGNGDIRGADNNGDGRAETVYRSGTWVHKADGSTYWRNSSYAAPPSKSGGGKTSSGKSSGGKK